MKKPMPELATAEEIAVTRDLAAHASQRVNNIVADAAQLVNNEGLAYALALDVVATLICALARGMHNGKTHQKNIARVMDHIGQAMRLHVEHGDL